jgi:small subunit ribosomal protein S9
MTDMVGKYDIYAKVKGGGMTGQADAVRHGIAKTLLTIDPATRAVLKKALMLTRDARKKERKKYGQKGARNRFQYSKR